MDFYMDNELKSNKDPCKANLNKLKIFDLPQNNVDI